MSKSDELNDKETAKSKQKTEVIKEKKPTVKKETKTVDTDKKKEETTKKVVTKKVENVPAKKTVKEVKIVKEEEPVKEIEVADESIKPEKKVKEKKIKKEKVKKEKKPRVPFKLWIAEHKATVIISSIVVCLLIVLAILLGIFFATDGSKIAVKYNGGNITKSVYETYYKLFSPILQYYYGYPDEASIKSEIANKVVLDRLILSDMDKSGMNITITEDEKQKIEEQLADKDKLASYNEQGINIEILKQLFYEDVRITKYLDAKKKAITDDNAKEYAKNTSSIKNKEDLNKYVTRHILFKIESDATDEKKAEIEKKANDVLARVKAGEKISNLAAEFSDDSSKSDGGKYEMYMDGNTVAAYETAVKMLTVGSVTQNLVKTEYGFHIIELSEIVPNGRIDKIKDEMINNDLEKMQKDANVVPVQNVIAEVK